MYRTAVTTFVMQPYPLIANRAVLNHGSLAFPRWRSKLSMIDVAAQVTARTACSMQGHFRPTKWLIFPVRLYHIRNSQAAAERNVSDTSVAAQAMLAPSSSHACSIVIHTCELWWRSRCSSVGYAWRDSSIRSLSSCIFADGQKLRATRLTQSAPGSDISQSL